MKFSIIYVHFILIAYVRGAWLAAIVQPVIVGLGAVLTALNQDGLDIEPFEFKLPFLNKQE